VTQLIIGDLRTGRRILDLPHTSLNWTLTRNTAGTIRATVPLNPRMIRKLDLQNATTPAKTFMCVIENDIPLEAGPIWRRTYSKATGMLELTAGGLWTYFDHRQIVPLLTDDQGVIDPATGESAAWGNTDLVNFSYGTIAKKVLEQSMLWTGGDLPIVFQADEVGTYERHYLGANLTKIGEALRDLVALVSGVDIRFVPRRTADRLGIEWMLQTGTLAAPELRAATPHVWDYSVEKPAVRNLQTEDDASRMTGQAWFTGGRQAGISQIVRDIAPALVDAGYPLLESVDSTHSDVSESDTLMAYAQNATLLGRAPLSAWSFEVRADVAPRVGSYLPGDLVTLKIANDPWIREAPYTRDISSISGDQDGKWIKVVTEETIDA
jgi:hypothetical protein